MIYIDIILDTFNNITKDFLFSYNGFKLGLQIFLLGLLLDNTISYKSKKLIQNKDSNLLNRGYHKVSVNLLVLSPFMYYILENYLISKSEITFNLLKYFLILIIHSFGYYFAHLAMHKINYFKQFHKFHHKFVNILIPSIGNAVSSSEFVIAYASPFIFASFILDANLITLNYSIKTVSIFNLFIHCNELNYLKYPNILVSPNDHISHHKLLAKKNTYSAPFINLDYIVSKFVISSSSEGSDEKEE